MITVLFFGELRELVGEPMVKIPRLDSQADLRRQLLADYPKLAGKTFSIAVNRKITDGIEAIVDGDEVALMPPFSGG